MVDDRLLRQLLVTWLAPVDPGAAQLTPESVEPQQQQQRPQQLPDLEASDLLPSLQLLPGIRTGKAYDSSGKAAAPAERCAVSLPGSCCRVRLHGLASDSCEPCAMDEPPPARSPIEVCLRCVRPVCLACEKRELHLFHLVTGHADRCG